MQGPADGGNWYDNHGWYSFIGPYIDEVGWAKSIRTDVSFSSPTNEQARRLKIPLFECPSDGGMVKNEWPSSSWARWRGNYAVNFGNTYYGQDKATSGGLMPALDAVHPAQPRWRGELVGRHSQPSPVVKILYCAMSSNHS
jgi:hypothetical protein